VRVTPEVADAALVVVEHLRLRGFDLPEAQHEDWCCAKGCPGVGFCATAGRGEPCDLSCKCSARDEMIYFGMGYGCGWLDATT
jgi:hypothetical protein